MNLLKTPVLRDRRYLDSLRQERCVITGHYGNDNMAVDPCHIGTAGRGMKSPDNEALPLRHDIHVRMHNEGEISVLRELAPDHLLRAAFRALAREMYSSVSEGDK